MNRTWMRRLSKEKCLLRQAKNRSSIDLNNQSNLPGRFSEKDMSQKRARKNETPRKISKGKLLPPH